MSSLSLPLTPSLHHRRHSPSHPSLSSVLSSPKLSPRSFSLESLVCRSSLSDYDREEGRWLREEQRWLREEQRWFRDEKKWYAERSSLILEIEALKLRIQSLERGNPLEGLTASQSDVISSISGLLNLLKEKSMIVETSSGAAPLILEEKSNREEIVKEVVVKEVVEVADKVKAEETVKKVRKTLRKAEGAEVRVMQEALLKLGFFSGEEDMEFSSFSSGTERAVKTWQATFGATEDGIMTAELLERLNMEKINENAESNINVMEQGNQTLNHSLWNGWRKEPSVHIAWV